MNALTTLQIDPHLATLADQRAVSSAFMSYLKEVRGFGHDLAPTWRNVERVWQGIFAPAIDHHRSAIFLGKISGIVVGAIFWVPADPSWDWNEPLAIDHGAWTAPDWRRQGVATTLRKAGMERLRELGIKSLVSNICEGNLAGRESYRFLEPQVIGLATKVRVN